MKYSFPAIFEQDEEDSKYINVTFPDLVGVMTFGVGMEDALFMAKDVLLSSLDYDHVKNTKPTSLEKTQKNFPGKKILLVEVEK